MRTAILALLLACLTGAALFFPAPGAVADVDDFSYDSWHADYTIDTDSTGRAFAEVTETIVARFPEFDQNRGIIRGLPLRYEGAKAAPENVTVTDEHGDPTPFWVEDEGGFRAILTGDDSFVHGVRTYVITYTLTDIVLAADDTEVDEFYWDLLPLERQQDVERFSAEITFSPELAPALTGDMACYSGQAGSPTPCLGTMWEKSVSDAGGSTIVVPSSTAPARSGVTVAIALEPGTVTQPPARTPSFAATVLPVIMGGAGLLAGLGALFSLYRLRVRHRTFRGTVVAQYDVPPYLPPLVAAPIFGTSGSPIGSQILHLAVQGCIRIEDPDAERAGPVSKRARPVLRLIDAGAAQDRMDTRTLEALFPSLEPGAAFTLPRRSEAFAKTMRALVSDGKREAGSRKYFTSASSRAARVCGAVALSGIAVAALLLIMGGLQGRDLGSTAAITVVLAIPAVVLACVAFFSHRVHSPDGAEAREYLAGVREFIRVAEADRLRVLQSYTGAERLPDGSVNVVHLYEKLLPYAMLFGMVKEWSRVLKVAYETTGVTTPYWYPALGTHGLHGFDSRLTSLTQSIQSSASYTSSSSGGSSGGGFSGGGGGGGFSGGR